MSGHVGVARSPRRRAFLLLSLCLVSAVAASAQQDFSKVEIRATDLGSGLFMLTGAGGNIGVSAGDDGVLVVDDQFAPLHEKIQAAIRKFSAEPIRFVLNTHWHGDHTEGNAELGRIGATIVAHDAVRARMSVSQTRPGRTTVPASPPDALPVVTFDQGVTFHLNGQTIDVHHVADAHTDGDAIVHFREADLLHLGDVFFSASYPFIDLGTGGGIDGLIAAVERALELAGPDTRIIPGHGPLSKRSDLVQYHRALKGVRDHVRKMIAAGQSRAEIISARPSQKYDALYPRSFIKADAFVGTVYASLMKEKR